MAASQLHLTIVNAVSALHGSGSEMAAGQFHLTIVNAVTNYCWCSPSPLSRGAPAGHFKFPRNNKLLSENM